MIKHRRPFSLPVTVGAIVLAMAAGASALWWSWQPPATIAFTEDKVFPADSGIINVKTEYGAKGDGVTDDTLAIQRAISEHLGFKRSSKILYFPQGTYLVSDTLEWKDRKGSWNTYLTLQGQSRDRTVIKLKDQAPGFTNPAQPKAVIFTASVDSKQGNRAHNNSLDHLTIDTGKGNPGAIGVDYLASNRGAMRDVTIRSGDGQGQVGLAMVRRWIGPCLIKNVKIIGFDYGIQVNHPEYSVTLENIALERQNKVGIENRWNVLSIRGLTSTNRVPAIRTQGANPKDNRSLVVLLDATLSGGDGSRVAIANNSGNVYLRNVKASGYRAVLRDKDRTLSGLSLTEYVSGPIMGLFGSGQKSLNLPVEDTPVVTFDQPSRWANIASFGATANDDTDDTAAIQAALDSGKSTIYFPTGRYRVSRSLQVRGAVRSILGMESRLSASGAAFKSADRPNPIFRFEPGTSDVVLLERLTFQGEGEGLIGIEQATPKTLVLLDSQMHRSIVAYRSTKGAGPLFIEDVVATRWQFDHPQKIWARQLNAEGQVAKIRNMGAHLWILGLKTEGPNTVIETIAGGKTELLGGLLYPVRPVSPELAAFINTNAQSSFIYAISAYEANRTYSIQVKETRGGTTKTLSKGNALRRDKFGSLMPLYVGY